MNSLEDRLVGDAGGLAGFGKGEAVRITRPQARAAISPVAANYLDRIV